MRKREKIAGLLALVAGAAGFLGCGTPDAAFSCTTMMSSSQTLCVEYPKDLEAAKAQVQQQCTAGRGTFADGACTRDNAAFSCTAMPSGSACGSSCPIITTVTYKPFAADQVDTLRQSCVKGMGTFMTY